MSTKNKHELWTIVHREDRQPVVPFDCNPGCDDEGMLVYWNYKAARSAATHQNLLYGIKSVPARLSEVVASR